MSWKNAMSITPGGTGCIPAVVRPDKAHAHLIRGDDIEYGLRNCKRLVTLNGICVWHEPFESKYSLLDVLLHPAQPVH